MINLKNQLRRLTWAIAVLVFGSLIMPPWVHLKLCFSFDRLPLLFVDTDCNEADVFQKNLEDAIIVGQDAQQHCLDLLFGCTSSASAQNNCRMDRQSIVRNNIQSTNASLEQLNCIGTTIKQTCFTSFPNTVRKTDSFPPFYPNFISTTVILI